MPHRRALVLTLVLTLGLATPAAWAASPLSPAGAPEVLQGMWGWLVDLWQGNADAGCNIDPNGSPRCAPVTAHADLGCNIDPNGSPRCAQASAQVNAGCNIDPNGSPRCASATAQADLGCNIDPDGRTRCAP